MNLLCIGMAIHLSAITAFWIYPRAAPRPAGTLAMCGFMGSFALSFVLAAPLIRGEVVAASPWAAGILSNVVAIAAASSALLLSAQINLEPADALRRIRSRILPVAITAFALVALFTGERATDRWPRFQTAEEILFTAYLGAASINLAYETLRQTRCTQRTSMRIGLRVAALGCGIWLIYALFLCIAPLSPQFAQDAAAWDQTHAEPERALFLLTIASPTLGVLLISLGLTVPAVFYPIAEARRRRWEVRSFDRLGPMWHDLSTAIPEIVLPTILRERDAGADSDFLLQRRVVEISDAILTLRPYRSQRILEAVQQAVGTGTERQAALIEAVAVRVAIAAMKAGRRTEKPARPSADLALRGDLRADTQWLLQVADAYMDYALNFTADKRSAVGSADPADHLVSRD